MTKAAELRQKDVAGLEAEVKALQKAHFGLRMQKATQQLGNTATLRATRRDIARAKTILAEKQAANQGALEGWFSFRHVGSLLGGLLFSKNGLCTGDGAAGGTQRVGVSQLLGSLLHTQTEMGLLQGLDFGFDTGNVFLAQFSSLHCLFS